jgi:hypothetical protein
MADFPHDDTPAASPFDAYQSPPISDAPPTASESTPKAGRIKTLCIVVIVLAGLGLANALMGAVGLLVGQQMQAAFTMGNQPNVPQRVQDLQRDMQRGLQAVQDRFLAVNAVLLAAHAIVAAGLLAGGIQSLRRKVPGRKILIAACLSAIAFELIRGTVQAFMQVQVMSITMRFFQEMMEASMNEAAEAAEWVAWGARVGIVVGVLMLIGWILAKVVFYGFAVWYLRKPAVRQYLDTAEVTAVVV